MNGTELDALTTAAKQAKADGLAFKRAIIERLLPQIDACAGKYKHEQIVDALKAAGVDLTLRTFRVTLSRARNEPETKN
jgi:hypothetical protein